MSARDVDGELVLRLACAYGLAGDAPKEWPELPLWSDGYRIDLEPVTRRQLAIIEGMWARGASLKRIAYAAGMSKGRVEAIVRRDRERFPYRRGPYGKEGR